MSNIFTDSVDLNWSKCDGDVDFYEIRYRKKNDDEKNWKAAKTNSDQSQITITGLMADTTYVFQVRGVFEDHKGEYSSENDVQTFKSLATYLKDFSTEVTNGNPSIRQLLTKELENTRNKKEKTKKLILGKFVCQPFNNFFFLISNLLNPLK